MSASGKQSYPRVTLKEGKEKSLLRGHPWIFSGAIANVSGTPALGETVTISDSRGREIALGAFSPHSQIRVRCWSFDPEVDIDMKFFTERIREAIQIRRPWLDEDNNAGRLIFGESDGLPGLIVDLYHDVIVCQFLSAGVEKWKKEITEILNREIKPRTIYERSDTTIRNKEGMKPVSGLLAGEDPPETVSILQNGLQFLVNVRNGHKTGFYLDQKENRSFVGRLCNGLEVLDVFSYTGSFTAEALRGGARNVTNVDSSAGAHGLAKQILALNGLDSGPSDFITGDAFEVLRKLVEEGKKYDLVITDPPKFSETRSQLLRASRAYKDINLQATRLLRPGGFLVSFSCSGAMDRDLFQKIVGDSVRDAGRHGLIVRELQQSPDHPVSLDFPESRYLKGLVCRVW